MYRCDHVNPPAAGPGADRRRPIAQVDRSYGLGYGSDRHEIHGTQGNSLYSSPEGNCNAVGEHALGMLLALIRRIAVGGAEIKQGIWRREENRGTELEGKTVGIIGCGHAGRAFARKLAGFDMRILAYDKYAPGNIPPGIISCNSLHPILEEADIVSFHVPAQPDTVHYFNGSFVAAMRKPFVLVNTSRGVVVDTRALSEGLASGKVAGACLDVFEQEPLPAMDPILQDAINDLATNPSVVLTPHIAGYTFEAVYKMSKVLLDKIIVGL